MSQFKKFMVLDSEWVDYIYLSNGVMGLCFKNGDTAEFPKLGEYHFNLARVSESPGRFVNNVLKNQTYIKVPNPIIISEEPSALDIAIPPPCTDSPWVWKTELTGFGVTPGGLNLSTLNNRKIWLTYHSAVTPGWTGADSPWWSNYYDRIVADNKWVAFFLYYQRIIDRVMLLIQTYNTFEGIPDTLKTYTQVGGWNCNSSNTIPGPGQTGTPNSLTVTPN